MSPRTPPGETRDRIYRYLVDRLLRGDPPTTREVQEAFGFRAVQTAREHLERLVEEGRLEKTPGKSRGYTLPESLSSSSRQSPSRQSPSRQSPSRESSNAASRAATSQETSGTLMMVPVLGRVHAGDLEEAIENPQGYVPGMALGIGVFFALEVEGDSMIEAGILAGDQVIVRAQASAEPGDIVVALVGDEATVKRFKRRRGRIELHPENSAYSPIIPEKVNREGGQQARLLGKVIEVRRRL